jgi:hypothetical protein
MDIQGDTSKDSEDINLFAREKGKIM